MLTTTLQVAAMTGASLSDYSNTPISGFGIDSRRIEAGDLFVALRGNRQDGHDFITQAIARGAAAVLAETSHGQAYPVPVLRVANTLPALQLLASAWRQQFSLPGIVVVGSNGKTTAKGMISSILSHAFGSDGFCATAHNENNHIGVAKTLLGLRAWHRSFAVEIGSNHPGEIAPLALLARPSVVVLTNAQRDHQAHFASVEAGALENGSALAALTPEGTAVLPADDACAGLWRSVANGRQTLSFGFHPGADVRISDCDIQPDCSTFSLSGVLYVDQVRLMVPGRHNVLNAAACAAAGMALGLQGDVIRKGLEACRSTPGRLAFTKRPDGLLVIDDSYNANPDSVKASIDVLAEQAGEKWLVLGDMGECGNSSRKYHAEVGEYARACKIDVLAGVGSEAAESVNAFGRGGRFFTDQAALTSWLRPQRLRGVILIKGSRHMKMELVVQSLLNAVDHQ